MNESLPGDQETAPKAILQVVPYAEPPRAATRRATVKRIPLPPRDWKRLDSGKFGWVESGFSRLSALIALFLTSILFILLNPLALGQETTYKGEPATFWVRQYDPKTLTFRLEPTTPIQVTVLSEHSAPNLVLKLGAVAECRPIAVVKQVKSEDLQVYSLYLECDKELYRFQNILFAQKNPRGN